MELCIRNEIKDIIEVLRKNQIVDIKYTKIKLITGKLDEEIIEAIIKNNGIPKELVNNYYLFKLCLNNNVSLNIIKQFDISLWTDKFINENQNKIIELLKCFFELPPMFKNNLILLKMALANNVHITVINGFSYNLWTDEFINENKNDILNLINSFEIVPFSISNNPLVLKLCIDNNVCENVFKTFSSSIWTEEIIKKYQKFILNFIKNNKLFDSWLSNTAILKLCINNISYKKCLLFLENAWSEEVIEKNEAFILNSIVKLDTVPNGLKNKTSVLKMCLENNLDIRIILRFNNQAWTKDLFTKYYDFIFSSLINNDIDYKEYFKYNSKLTLKCLEYSIKNNNYTMFLEYLNIKDLESEDKKRICENLRKILLIDEDAFDYLDVRIFAMNFDLNYYEILEFSRDKTIQNKLINFNRNEVILFNKIMKLLRNYKYIDIRPIVYNIINQMNNYDYLTSNIDFDKITNRQLSNLIYVMQGQSNFMEIKELDDLDDDNIAFKFNYYFNEVSDKIKSNLISINDLKYAILLKRFRLLKNNADFIYNRYCSLINIERIKKSNNNSLENILVQIYDIYNIDDMDLLKEMYLETDNNIKIDYSVILILEMLLRNMYAKMYEDSLYKLNPSDKYNLSIVKSEKVKKILNSLKNKGITFYVLSNDFSMQVHSIHAYSNKDTPIDDYGKDWYEDITKTHGVCVSYIRQDSILIADSIHPAYAFINNNGSNLYLSAPYDLMSYNTSYAITLCHNDMFLAPNDMINYSRLLCNEQVRERFKIVDGEILREKPYFIPYVVDDINDEYNFIDDKLNINEEQLKQIFYYKNVLKCAREMDLPIVIVDRLYFANLERKKCDYLLEQFKNNFDLEILNKLFIKIFNNMVSCRVKDNSSIKEYNKVFNDDTLYYYIEQILLYIFPQNLNVPDVLKLLEERKNILEELINIIKNECKKNKNYFYIRPLKQYIELLDNVKNQLDEMLLKKVKCLRLKNVL